MSQNILNTSKVSELFFQTVKGSLLPARMKKIQLKNESARVFTSLYNDFSDAQGQVTL